MCNEKGSEVASDCNEERRVLVVIAAISEVKVQMVV